jgi:hypothetical protein
MSRFICISDSFPTLSALLGRRYVTARRMRSDGRSNVLHFPEVRRMRVRFTVGPFP